MSKIIFILLLKMALANWNENWLVATKVQWPNAKPQAADPVGISVYCGFGYSTQRTKVFLTLQNRGNTSLCLHPNQLVSLTPNEMKKVADSLPVLGRGLLRSVIRSHLKLKKFSEQRVRTNFNCRVLNPQNDLLPLFTYDEKDPASCSQAQVSLPPEGIFEIDYEFYVPYLVLSEFNIEIPSTCDGSKGSPTNIVFRCVNPAQPKGAKLPQHSAPTTFLQESQTPPVH